MTAIELIQALRQMSVETGSLVCLDCEHEHKCGIHGCAIMRTAADLLEQLIAEPPNELLTLEELRGMDGEPVWCKDNTVDAGIIRLAEDWATERLEAHFWTFDAEGNPRCYNVRLMLEMGANFYRRKPDGGVE